MSNQNSSREPSKNRKVIEDILRASGDGYFEEETVIALESHISQQVAAARLDEFKIGQQYIDTDYIECNGYKCRLPWCGSCCGEDKALERSEVLKKERQDRLEQLAKEKGEVE